MTEIDEHEERTVVDEIIDCVVTSMHDGGVETAIADILDDHFGEAVAIAKDQELHISNEVQRRLTEAFSAFDSELSVSDGFLRLALAHNDLHTTINLIDHIEDGIRAAGEANILPEDAEATISGIDEFIGKLATLRDLLANQPTIPAPTNTPEPPDREKKKHQTSGALLNTTEAAKRAGKSVSWMNHARQTGEGPVFLKIGVTIRYRPADVDAWLDTKAQTKLYASS